MECVGRLRPGVVARDIVQELLATDRSASGQGAIGIVFEFTGPVVKAMSLDERATLTNMVAEMGGFSGFIEPDETTVCSSCGSGAVSMSRSKTGCTPIQAPATETSFGSTATGLSPMVATPGRSRELHAGRWPAGACARSTSPTAGSCTAAKREDFDFYHEVLKWGLDHGLRVPRARDWFCNSAPWTFANTAGQRDIWRPSRRSARRWSRPAAAPATTAVPGQTTSEDQVSITSINRNFPGRSGPGKAWLGSPYTVAASALAGYVTSFDALRSQSQKHVSCSGRLGHDVRA